MDELTAYLLDALGLGGGGAAGPGGGWGATGWTRMFNAEMGVDVALNQADILARLIAEEMSLGDMMTLLKLRRGKYSLVEEKLRANSRALGVPLREMTLPPTCVIAAVIRKGKVITPHGQMTFEAEDEVLAVVDNASLEALRSFLA